MLLLTPKEKRQKRQKKRYERLVQENPEKMRAKFRKDSARYRQKNPDKVRERRRRHYQENIEKMREEGRRRYQENPEAGRKGAWRRQGIDPNKAWGLLLKATQCEICGCTDKVELCIDHCHKTGDIRGILCFNCNTSIGKLGDNPGLVLKAAEYLMKAEW